jgi:hypothetical protein
VENLRAGLEIKVCSMASLDGRNKRQANLRGSLVKTEDAKRNLLYIPEEKEKRTGKGRGRTNEGHPVRNLHCGWDIIYHPYMALAPGYLD